MCKLVLFTKNQHAFQSVQYLFFLTWNRVFPKAINMPYALSSPPPKITTKKTRN